MYVLKFFDEDLKPSGLHEEVRSTYFGMEISVPNYFTIFELYYPASGIFFAPVSELGLAFYKMWEILNLLMGSLPFNEYFLLAEELKQLEKDDLALFEMYHGHMSFLHLS